MITDIKFEKNANDRWILLIEKESFSDLMHPQNIDYLSWPKDKDNELRYIDAFLKSGKQRLFVCKECAKPECGQIVVDIQEHDNCFIWSNYRLDYGSGGEGSCDLALFKNKEYTFEKQAYSDAFNDYKEKILAENRW